METKLTRDLSFPEPLFLKDLIDKELIHLSMVSEHRRKEMNNELLPEPLLTEDKSRFVLFPIKYADIWETYGIEESRFWTIQSIDLSGDLKHWISLTDNERFFYSNVFAFFACFDGIVSENISNNFINDFPIPEIRMCFNFQNMMEGIHNHGYSLLIETYIKDNDEKIRLLNGIRTIPWLAKKAEWYIKYMDKKTHSLHERLIASCITEGLLFSSSFVSIFNLKERGLMHGLAHFNAEVAIDEGCHTNRYCLLYNKLVNKLSEDEIYSIFNEAIDIETEFICKSLPTELIGMNSKLMMEYVKFCADKLLIDLKYNKLYNSKNPFEFMERLSLDYKSNFFEKLVSEYSLGDQPKILSFTEDF